jgi:hypothetical protein
MVVEVELLRVLRCWVCKENESEKSVAEKKHGVPLVFHSFTLSLLTFIDEGRVCSAMGFDIFSEL